MTISDQTLLLMFVTVATAVATLILLHTKRLAAHKKITDNLPADLKGATLFLCEKYIHIEEPILLGGKPDEVWAREDRTLVVVDTKNRKKFQTTKTDKFQLTGYAMILKYHPMAKGRKLANYGYVRFPSPAGDVFLKVPLLSEHEYQNLYARHRLLREGKVQARGPKSVLFCNGCGHTEVCNRTYKKAS